MDLGFITNLPDEVENADFRVIADEGGYSDAILGLHHQVHGRLLVVAQRDQMKVFLEVYTVRDQIARDGSRFCFDGFTGELLTPDARPSGNFIMINVLSIDPRRAAKGETVGVLKMTQLPAVPSQIKGVAHGTNGQ